MIPGMHCKLTLYTKSLQQEHGNVTDLPIKNDGFPYFSVGYQRLYFHLLADKIPLNHFAKFRSPSNGNK